MRVECCLFRDGLGSEWQVTNMSQRMGINAARSCARAEQPLYGDVSISIIMIHYVLKLA
jgi:hypothetical protein